MENNTDELDKAQGNAVYWYLEAKAKDKQIEELKEAGVELAGMLEETEKKLQWATNGRESYMNLYEESERKLAGAREQIEQLKADKKQVVDAGITEDFIKSLFPDYLRPHPNKHIWESPDYVLLTHEPEDAKVRLIIWDRGHYVKIMYNFRHYDEWETVFLGFVKSQSELLLILRLIGLPEPPASLNQQTDKP